MQVFTMNIFGRKTKNKIRDLAALLRLWNRDVKITLDNKVLAKFKKICSEDTEYENYGHIIINSPVSVEMIYNKNSLDVLQITIVENKKRIVYVPYKRVTRNLKIISQRRK